MLSKYLVLFSQDLWVLNFSCKNIADRNTVRMSIRFFSTGGWNMASKLWTFCRHLQKKLNWGNQPIYILFLFYKGFHHSTAPRKSSRSNDTRMGTYISFWFAWSKHSWQRSSRPISRQVIRIAVVALFRRRSSKALLILCHRTDDISFLHFVQIGINPGESGSRR